MHRTVPVAILLTMNIMSGCGSQRPLLTQKVDYPSSLSRTLINLEVPPNLSKPQIHNK